MRLAPLFLLVATPALGDVPRVVTDFGPVQSLVADVMGDLGQPRMLLPPGADPHDFQLRPSQAQALAQADLVFWIGPEMMPELDETFATLAPQAQVTALLPMAAVTRSYGEGEEVHGEDHEDGQEEGQAQDHEEGHAHDHAHDGADPHAWLNPLNGIAWAGHIASVLGQKDPANATTYAANAAALAESLSALDAQIAGSLRSLADKPFITYHDALGHFTDHYGLAVVGAIELGDASTPSAAQLAEVRGLLDGAGVVCVFPEAGRDPKYITALTDGLTVRVGGAQDIEFITIPAGPGQYAALLQGVAATLVDCLSQ